MATAFGTIFSYKWPVMGDNDMGISYKGWLVFSQSSLLGTLPCFVAAVVGTAPGGRLSGWELTR